MNGNADILIQTRIKRIEAMQAFRISYECIVSVHRNKKVAGVHIKTAKLTINETMKIEIARKKYLKIARRVHTKVGEVFLFCIIGVIFFRNLEGVQS